jgi:NCAIR mutase (PurE)-related protein
MLPSARSSLSWDVGGDDMSRVRSPRWVRSIRLVGATAGVRGRLRLLASLPCPDVDERTVRRLLEGVRSGDVSPDDAVAQLRRLPYADLGFARVDHHRALRQGMAEAVYAPGKSPEHCAAIVAELLDAGGSPVLLTRSDPDQARAALDVSPGGEQHGTTVVWRPAAPRPEVVVLCTAGTADLPVADECAATLHAHGIDPVRHTDVGVAGVHRLLSAADDLARADAVVVVAGMEGALASLVGGITPAPVVAVPTSAGYGASLEGVTALLAMLASCAAGLAVVGIDNGFGAAMAVLRTLK